jgi:glycosyltransferase involved in cell wall biosynthesis
VRILQLAQWYPPLIGGEEGHVRNLSRALAASGHDVTVATLWQPGLPDVEQDGDVRVHRLHGTVQRAGRLFADGSRRSAPPAPDPGTTRSLARLVAEFRPDVVHAHNWMVHAFLPLKRRRGPRLVVSLHDYSLVCATKALLYRGEVCSGPGLTKCLSCAAGHYGPLKGMVTAGANWTSAAFERRLVDLFLPVSRAVAIGNGLPGGQTRFEIVPNFAPSEIADVEPGRRDRRLPEDGYLLFVGAFARLKGVDRLLAAYRRIERPPPLVLVGYRHADTAAMLRNLPRGVIVHESWPHADVMQAWAGSLMGLIPSVWGEPCPTTAIEAMATGTPVIASRIGGLTDLVVDGETGLLVPPRDVDALADAIQGLLRDDDYRRRLGAAARSRFATFSADAVVPRIEAAYERVLTGAASSEVAIA